MFPLQHSHDELRLQDPSILQQDLSVDQANFLERSNLNVVTKNPKKRPRISKSDLQENQNIEESNEIKIRKIMHREIERQRRQEMTSLYASLRDLLPVDFIKGKRSVSDHMQEAVKYIKHMEMNIKELRMRREKLKNVSSVSSASENGSSNSVIWQNCVTVNSCCDGVEILINCGTKEGYEFPLSTVIMELLRAGLNIVSCISTKVNERFLYRIRSEVNSLAYINLSELQQRLADLIN